MSEPMSAAEWTALILTNNGGIRDDGHWHGEHCPGVPAFPCHCIDIENEMSDYRMIMHHCTEIYDVASGGRVTKPNTLPSVVIDFMEERERDVEAERDALRQAGEGLRDALESCMNGETDDQQYEDALTAWNQMEEGK
jgi:hypothetical protein